MAQQFTSKRDRRPFLYRIAAVSILIVFHFNTRADKVAIEGRGQETTLNPVGKNLESLCEKRTQTLHSKISAKTPVRAGLQSILRDKPRLVLVGESHAGYSLRGQPDLLRQLKKIMPDLDCLFIEYPSTAEKDLKAIFDNRLTDIDNGNLIERMDSYRTAKNLGIKVIPVDQLQSRGQIFPGVFDPKGPNPPWTMTPEGLNARDENMTSEIERHMSRSKGQCHKGVLFVGKGHLSNFDNPSRRSIMTILKSKNVRFASINMVNTGTDAFGNDSLEWKWEVCKRNPAPPDEVTAFSNSDIPKEVTIFPRAAKWSDFDMSIIYPNRPFKSLMSDEIRRSLGERMKKAMTK